MRVRVQIHAKPKKALKGPREGDEEGGLEKDTNQRNFLMNNELLRALHMKDAFIWE